MTLSRFLLVLGIVLAASSADCLALCASADCVALARPMRCGRPCMAAKKRAKQVTRREALSGGGFDSDEVYKDFANAGLREPLLFGGIAVVAAFGLSQRGQFVDTLTALDAAQPPEIEGRRPCLTFVDLSHNARVGRSGVERLRRRCGPKVRIDGVRLGGW